MATMNPDIRDLYDACSDRDIPRIKELLNQGITPQGAVPMQPGDTLLHAPCVLMDREIAELLIEAGAELDARDRNNQTPLMRAVYYGQTLSLLIEKGASLELTDGQGRTALSIATEHRPEAAEFIKNVIKLRRQQKAAGKAEQKKLGVLHDTASERQNSLKKRCISFRPRLT